MSDGRHDVRPRARVRQRCFSQPLQRGIVVYVAVFDRSAMAVAGVFAIANVGDNQQLTQLAPQRTDGALHNAVLVVRARRDFVLRFRQPEQHHAADAQR